MTSKDTLTCYLVERDGLWEGLCMDYDIAVRGRTSNDTRDRLGIAVRRYVADLMDEAGSGSAERRARRAPWKVRTVLAIRAAWPNKAQRFSVWSIAV